MSLEMIRSTSDGADAAPSALASATAPRIAPRGCYKPMIRPAELTE